MFEDSNEFFLKMGLEDNKMSYNPVCDFTEDVEDAQECQKNLPMIEEPGIPGWDVVCHASAWDFYKTSLDDYR